MKILIKGMAVLLVLLTLASLAACGGDEMTTPATTTPKMTTPGGDDPLRPGDSTPSDTNPGTDPMLPGDSTPMDTNPTDTTSGDTPGGDAPGNDTAPADSGVLPGATLENAAELLEEGIRLFRGEPTVRLGRITSGATVDGTTNESVTSFRFERTGNDFYAHTDSGADTSDVTVVGSTAYVRIGSILREKATVQAADYNKVLYSATLSVLDALDIASFSQITGQRLEDGGARIVCHGIADRETEKLEAVLNTVNMDMTDVAESVECVFLLDAQGRIVEEHCSVGTTVGHALRATDNHTVHLMLTVDATCEYPGELTIQPPTDAESYKQVPFEEVFA